MARHASPASPSKVGHQRDSDPRSGALTGTPEDYRKVHAFQDRLSRVPLSALASPTRRRSGGSIPVSTPSKTAVAIRWPMEPPRYSKVLASAMKSNPPLPADAPMVAELARIGIGPGAGFRTREQARSDHDAGDAERAAERPGEVKSADQGGRGAQAVGSSRSGPGVYGTDYLQRAFITAFGLGPNHPEDAVYPVSEADPEQRP